MSESEMGESLSRECDALGWGKRTGRKVVRVSDPLISTVGCFQEADSLSFLPGSPHSGAHIKEGTSTSGAHIKIIFDPLIQPWWSQLLAKGKGQRWNYMKILNQSYTGKDECT